MEELPNLRMDPTALRAAAHPSVRRAKHRAEPPWVSDVVGSATFSLPWSRNVLLCPSQLARSLVVHG